MFKKNCDFNHNLYIDGFQNGGYYIHRRQVSNLAGNLANDN